MFLTQLYIISILCFFNIYKKKRLPNIYNVYLFLLLFCLAAVDLSGVNDKLTKNSYNKIKVNKKQLIILEKQQICTCITLFCAFLCRCCTTTR